MIGLAMGAVSFVKSKWLPLLLAFVVISGGALYLNRAGYQKGVRVTEARMFKAQNEALRAQMAELNRVNEIDLKAAVRAATLEAKVKADVESIPIPAFPKIRCPQPTTNAVGVAVGPVTVDSVEPDFSDWLRFFNAAVPDPDTDNPG